jgi:hypothetical protein
VSRSEDQLQKNQIVSLLEYHRGYQAPNFFAGLMVKGLQRGLPNVAVLVLVCFLQEEEVSHGEKLDAMKM